MEENEFCNCQYRKDKTGKKYFKFKVLHEYSTKSSVYVWKRCENCGDLRLNKKNLSKT